MTSKKLEYDSSLGGHVVLGTHMPTFKYAASVLRETKDLISANKQSNCNKLVFQTLPKHMRRRAMSHHPKRLPRKYRAAHIHQMSKSGKPQETKRPSRKHRRRPQNLLKDYLRRQRKHKWLETHIWHAKRFHMIQKWGYKLPYASCDKTYRACYRATAENCLLQDISFYACVQIRAPVEEISRGFQKLTSKECGLSIIAKTYLNGRREGSIHLFKSDAYPFKALGKVSFMWCNETDEIKDGSRTLWLWLHPASYIATLEEFIKVFNLQAQKSCNADVENKEKTREVLMKTTKLENEKNSTKAKDQQKKKKCSVKLQRRLKFMTKSVERQNIQIYRNDTGSIELKELKDTLNRFRLTGPISQSILINAFKVKNIEDNLKHSQCWVREFSQINNNFVNNSIQQQQFWSKCKSIVTSPTDLLLNMILALNIEDPRVNRPQKRSKAICEAYQTDKCYDLLNEVTPILGSSVLWNERLRNWISNEMLSTHKYNELRAQHVVVPGEPCEFEENIQPVPVILIQRPGNEDGSYARLGYGCGWDIIAPAGYAMPIWLSLLMWGARPGGLREFNSIARELGTEEHLPDTVTGRQVCGDRYYELFSKYFRLPPNKRCNYQKLSIVSPFRVPFPQLLRDWCPSSVNHIPNNNNLNDYFVLRSREKLQDLTECVKRCNLQKFPSNLDSQCLIQIKLTMKSRGNPNDFSIICLPTKKDLKRNLKQIKKNDHHPVLTEPLMKDPNEKERNKVRVQHKKLLKRLRAQRVREKRKLQETSCTRVHIRPAGTSAICAGQFKKMCKLWLPEDTSTLFTVRKQAVRECFGYASTAGFFLTEGRVGATAYITVEGLRQLLKLCQQFGLKQAVCLIRSTNSRDYRFARIFINREI